MTQDLTTILEIVDIENDLAWPILFKSEPIFIDEENILLSIIPDLIKEPILGIDTENDRRWKYYERISLIQIATKERVYLIDTTKIKNLNVLKSIFSSKKIIKVIHDAKQDILDLKKQGITDIENIFDTFIATRLLGFGDHGYANLVRNIFEIKLDKKQQKADWSRRPLTEDMLQYAKSDVVFLIDLQRILSSLLYQNDLKDNALEYFEYILSLKPEKQIFNPGSFKRIKESTNIPPKNQLTLYNLYNWREKVASEKNRAPYLIVSNQTLLEISKILPSELDALKKIKGIGKSLFKKYSKEILNEIHESSKNNFVPNFEKMSTKRFISVNNKEDKVPNEKKYIYKLRMKNLLRWRDEESKNVNINSDTVIPRTILQKLSLQVPLTVKSKNELPIFPGFKTWRREKYSQEIFDILYQANISQICIFCKKKFHYNEIRAICPFCEVIFHINCLTRSKSTDNTIICPRCSNKLILKLK